MLERASGCKPHLDAPSRYPMCLPHYPQHQAQGTNTHLLTLSPLVTLCFNPLHQCLCRRLHRLPCWWKRVMVSWVIFSNDLPPSQNLLLDDLGAVAHVTKRVTHKW